MRKATRDIAALLEVTEDEAAKYCDIVRALNQGASVLRDREISKALKELHFRRKGSGAEVSRSEISPREVCRRSRQLATDRWRLARNVTAGRRVVKEVPRRLESIRRSGNQPVSPDRCSCGNPVVPGSDRCYACGP